MERATRRCPRCEVEKPLAEFGWRDKAHTKPQSYCRECTNKAWNKWYADEGNRQRHLDTVAKRRKRRLGRHQDLIRALKSAPCADCGRTYPYYVMDFDHLGGKKGEVSSFVYQRGTAPLLQEVAKCQVVCANCHRIRTFERRRLELEGQSDPNEASDLPVADYTRNHGA